MIDVRIFGVPERMDNIEKMKSRFDGNVTVVMDNEHSGCVPTARKTWLLHTDASHVLVLNDDVELCNDFMRVCDVIVERHPDKIITLFPAQFMSRDVLNNVGGMPKNSPYVSTDRVSGAGIIMPTEYVKPCVESWDKHTTEDDTSIYEWAKKNGISVITTLPAILQHLNLGSQVGHCEMHTDFYEENPVANWENSFVTPWTNLIR